MPKNTLFSGVYFSSFSMLTKLYSFLITEIFFLLVFVTGPV